VARNRWADTPRTADYGVQVLSRVLSCAVDLGKLAGNPCEGIKGLYSVDRSEVIWTSADIAELKAPAEPLKGCSKEVGHAVDLDACTGLRLSDLLRLSWSHIGADAIVITTGKSKHRREAIIPLYDELRAVLAGIPKRATTVLTSSHGRPWKKNGFGTAFQRAKKAAGIVRDLHFHDLRGTAATRFYTAGLSERAIAEIMGWEEEHVHRIIRRYVTRNAVIKATIAQINQAGRGTP
jgi:integrase